MIDEHDVREMLQRRAGAAPAAPAHTPKTVQRARRRLVLNGAVAMLAVVAIAVASLAGVDAIRSAPIPADTPVPVIRGNGEVLRFTGVIERDRLPDGSILKPMPGDLVAVDPRTGAERILVEDLDAVYWAGWSADGRWFAYETDTMDHLGRTNHSGRNLWVGGGSQAPRVVATSSTYDDLTYPGRDWEWSPTGAELATMMPPDTLRTIDVVTGETTDLGPAVADLGGWGRTQGWAWSPDGTHLVFASSEGDGSLYSVDVRSGERSLLARLPDVAPPIRINKILWSPDGAHIAVQLGEGDERGRLFVMDADGSDIRMMADDNNSLGVAWSPDGTRLAFGTAAEFSVRIRVARADGTVPAEIGAIGRGPCHFTTYGPNYECLLAWSPDGTQVAIQTPPARYAPVGYSAGRGGATVFTATGAGEGVPLDELTFAGWDSGWYRSA
jgi:Tol biopolymer transport system component